MSSSLERFVEIGAVDGNPGVRLRALREGPGPGAAKGRPLLVLHGFTGDAESMAGVSEALRGDRAVVRLELVGHGGSDAPRELGPYRMGACAVQICEAAAALDLEHPHLLGYSMGGRAALAAALAGRGMFTSLVLVGATAGIADRDRRRERIASDRRLADRIERDGVEAFVDEWMARPIFASQRRLGEESFGRARSQRLRNRAVGLANSLRGMGAGAQDPLHERLAELACPVLLVHGSEDAKFTRVAEELERALPEAQRAVLAEAGHAAHLEAPEHFARVVRVFLAAAEAADEATEEIDRRASAMASGRGGDGVGPSGRWRGPRSCPDEGAK
jgi:2-succinyl-6-hydroxy-2,4-cyclohexadiene-1-carboxylate synthase